MATYSNTRGTSEARLRVSGPKGRDVVVSPRYIDGFSISASGATAVVGAGACAGPDGELIEYAGGSIALGTSTAIGVGSAHNLFVNSGGIFVGEPPAPNRTPQAPYSGTARSNLTSNAVNRWIGTLIGKAVGTIHNTRIDAGSNTGEASFRQNTGVDNILVSGGAATVATTLTAGSFGHAAAMTHAKIRVQNLGASGAVRIYAWDGSAFVIMTNILINNVAFFEVPLDASGQFQYDNAAAGGSASINLIGYRYER